MTVSQQISPSALRAYKLSKYANGQPGKMLLEAKRVKRVTSQFMSKRGAKEAAKRMKALKKTATVTKKIADATKKAQDTMLGKVPGANAQAKASRMSAIIGILALIGVVALLKLQEALNSAVFDNIDSVNKELTKINTVAINNGLKLKTLDTKIEKFNKELDTNAKDYSRLNKQQESFGKSIVEAKKQANDALYETREGRKIVESKIAEAKKQSNDALYEARANKQNLEGQITGIRNSFDAKLQQINAQISKFNSNVSDTFQKTVNSTISKIQSDLAATRSKVDAIRPSTPADTASINANAVAAARALVSPLQLQVGQLNGEVNGLKAQVNQIPVLANSLGSLAKSLNATDNKADAAMNEARNKGVPNLAPLQQQLDDKFNRFIADNNKALGIRDLEQSNLAKEFDKKLADFNRQNGLTSDQRFNEFKKQMTRR